MTRSKPFWHWLRPWRDAKAVRRGPRAYAARAVRRRAHRTINRRVR